MFTLQKSNYINLEAKKRILFFHQSLIIGGSETILYNYLNILSQCPQYHIDLLLLEEPPSFMLERIPKNISVSYILTDIEAQFKIFLFCKLKETITEDEKHYFSSWDIGIKMREDERIHSYLNENAYNMIINFNGHLDHFLSRNNLNIPVIRWIHNAADEAMFENTPFFYRDVLPKYHAMVTISKTMHEAFSHLLQRLNLPYPVEMIYNPIDFQRIEQMMYDELPEDKTLLADDFIVSVARLFEYKNHTQMIDIYKQLKEKGIKEKLYIIGEGAEYVKQQLKQKIEHLGLTHDCFLLGKRGNPFPFMRKAKLFVHTSKLEGLPTVFMESMKCGTPIVAFDCPTGPKEILENGRYGALIPLNDEAAFITQTYELLTQEEKRKHYITLLPEAIERFSFEHIYAQLIHLLERL